MSSTYFISDLHLLPGDSDAGKLFARFCKTGLRDAERLYILGDFLEVWWGDDDPAEGYQPMFDMLVELAAKGTAIGLMHGNRDFMIGEDLARRCRFELLDDTVTIDINGQRALLMHGDTLCTDDIEYQKFRAMVRNPAWKQQVMQKTLEERLQLAASIRENSKQATSNKAEDIMDVNEDEVAKTFIDNDVDIIIHGHTHRPAIHRYDIDGRERLRIVLGDWHDSMQYLHVNGNSDALALSTLLLTD